MSVVEGRVVASLARASRVLSVCFIYIHETSKRETCQEFLQHFYKILFFPIGVRLWRSEPSPGGKDDARLSVGAASQQRPEQLTF